MNRLCTLHGRPSFSEPRPHPRRIIPSPPRGGGEGCAELRSGLSLWLHGGRCRSPTAPLIVVHGSFHYGGLRGLQGLFQALGKRESIWGGDGPSG